MRFEMCSFTRSRVSRGSVTIRSKVATRSVFVIIGQGRQLLVPKVVDPNARQSFPVPGRTLPGNLQQLAQARLSLLADLSRGPLDPRQDFRDPSYCPGKICRAQRGVFWGASNGSLWPIHFQFLQPDESPSSAPPHQHSSDGLVQNQQSLFRATSTPTYRNSTRPAISSASSNS